MAITLRFAGLGPEQVGFGISPGGEAMLSLHALLHARHHQLHIPWVVQARRRLSPALKAEVEAFSVLCRSPMAWFWTVRTDGGVPQLAADLADLAGGPIEAYAAEIIRLLVDQDVPPAEWLAAPEWRQKALDLAQVRHPQCLPMVQEFCADPERSRARLIGLLAAYWEAALAPEWPRIEALLLDDIAARRRSLAQQGPAGMLRELSPKLRVNAAAGTAVIRNPVALDVDAGQQLILAPSYFAWPHLVTRIRPPATLVYPAGALLRAARAPLPPEDLVRLLQAAGEPTRLQMLQALAQQPRSTREVAGVIGISEAAASKHLKKLQQAGLIEPQRNSYYVFYRLRPGALDAAARGLRSLGRPPG